MRLLYNFFVQERHHRFVRFKRSMDSAVFDVFPGFGELRVNRPALCGGVVAIGSGKRRSIDQYLRDKNDFALMKARFHHVAFSDARLGTQVGGYGHCAFVLDFYESCSHSDRDLVSWYFWRSGFPTSDGSIANRMGGDRFWAS